MWGIEKKLGIIAIILAIIIIATIVVGNYFMNIAIIRKDTFNEKIIPEAERNQAELHLEREEILKKNRKEINEYMTNWTQKAIMEKMNITSDDNLELIGNVYPQDSHKWIILVHGYMGKKEDMLSYASVYAEWGYNVLLPDLRAHGESEGKYIGMGWLDRKDIQTWIDEIISKDPAAEIVLHGVSMGAATVMMTSGEELPMNVKAIVEDCGYTSVWDIFSDVLSSSFQLPAFPVMHMSNIMTNVRAKYSLHASSIDQLKKSDTPTVFIHGAEDKFVGAYMLDECYEAKNGDKEYLKVEDARHGEAFPREPELYFSTIKEFVEKYVTE